MHELLMKVIEMRLKVIFGWSVCIVVYGSMGNELVPSPLNRK